MSEIIIPGVGDDGPPPEPKMRCFLCGSENITFHDKAGTLQCHACAKTIWPVVDTYDTEVRDLGNTQDALQSDIGKATNLEDWRKRAISQFEAIGFVVSPKIWYTEQEGTYAFDFEIVGRTEEFHWDPDRMVHEVTGDVLETGEGGVISTGGFNPFEE